MRITPEILMKAARDAVAQRSQGNVDFWAAFLHGSMLKGEPLLGGATDIDLFIVHNESPSIDHEVSRLTDEVTLDIAHFSRADFKQTRELRTHPWLGPCIYEAKILYDPHHFMDFTQASVRGQFYQPDNVLARSRPLIEQARQEWMSFQLNPVEPGPSELFRYLEAVTNASNALASLNGGPLTTRRFLLEFSRRAEAAGHQGLYHGLFGLMGGSQLDGAKIKAWLPEWRKAYTSIPADRRPLRYHPQRLNYYLHAMEAMLNSESPTSALWPLIYTWTEAASLGAEAIGWQQTAQTLNLLGDAFSERLAGLDAYIDTIEEIMDEWARKNGV